LPLLPKKKEVDTARFDALVYAQPGAAEPPPNVDMSVLLTPPPAPSQQRHSAPINQPISNSSSHSTTTTNDNNNNDDDDDDEWLFCHSPFSHNGPLQPYQHSPLIVSIRPQQVCMCI
jgi:hypothetical protein